MTTSAPAEKTNVPATINSSSLATRGATAEVEKQRAIAETVAAIQVARQFPRDEKAAIDRIIRACTRPTLAESALYSYARGGTEITGPSIRMAEAIAQNWGNMQFGVRELEQRNGESSVEAYAWDVETNTRSSKTFQVPHKRHTRERDYALTDPRDIYELVANMGARRLRACILSVVPGDVVEMAMDQVELTLRTRVEITPELIKSLVDKFAEVGVTKQMLEERIQRHIDAITPALVVQVGKWYNAIKDGMAQVSDFFVIPQPAEGTSTAEKIKNELDKRKPAAAAAAPAENADPVDAAPATEAVHPESQLPVDEKQRRAELRTAIATAWKDVPVPMREAILAREYGANPAGIKKTVLDLTTAQLEDLLERMPEIIKG